MRAAFLRARGRFLAVALAVCALAVFGGCIGKSKPPAEPTELTIAGINQMTFDAFYSSAFHSVYPNTVFKIVPMEEPVYYAADPAARAALRQLFETKKPDLAILSDGPYQYAANAGWLRDLENAASLNKFDLGTLHEGMLERARNNEEGKLYGLSPVFFSSAVFYNATLFQRYGVPLPKQDMTWDEILRLAGLFVDQPGGEEGIRGLGIASLTKPFDLMSSIARTEGIGMYNKAANRLTLDSEAWHAIMSKVIAAYEHGTFEVESYKAKGNYISMDESRQRDLFIQGKAALTVNDDYYVAQLKRQQQFEWGVLPGPVQSRDPSRGGNFTANFLFAIPAKSDHPEQAWKLIEAVLSEKMGEINSQRDFGLPSRVNGRMAKDPLYEAFYKLRPVPLQEGYSLGADEQEELQRIIDDEIGAAVAGRKSVDDAVAAIQEAGSRLLPDRR